MNKTIFLYSNEPPSGRALFLGKAIAEVSTISGRESLYLATDLFNSKYGSDAPLELSLKQGADISDFKKLCAEFGILIAGEE